MDKSKKDNLREIPTKNYIYLFLVLLGSTLLLIYVYKWYKTYNETKLNISIMSDYLTVINYNELDNYIIENKDAIIYVSVLGNEEINRFERKFKNIITENNLKNDILYLDLTNENQDKVARELQIESSLPYLVIYTNGQITDTYSISKTNYSSKKALNYLNRIGVTEND